MSKYEKYLVPPRINFLYFSGDFLSVGGQSSLRIPKNLRSYKIAMPYVYIILLMKLLIMTCNSEYYLPAMSVF